jgi:hypothetical protein
MAVAQSCGWRAVLVGAGLCLLLAACGGGSSGGGGSGTGSGSTTPPACSIAAVPGVFATRVVAYAPQNPTGATSAQWPYFFQPDSVLFGPPCGTNAAGLFDGVSLGYDRTVASSQGGEVILGFSDADGPRCIVDDGTTAPDFTVFGNQFFLDGAGDVYAKIATVDVAQTIPDAAHPDTATWHRFPPSFDTAYTDTQPAHYVNFAGVHPTSAGGDGFDLSSLSGLPVGFQACYVRLTDGGTLYPDYSNTQTDLYEGGAAIDAVQAISSVAAPGLTP